MSALAAATAAGASFFTMAGSEVTFCSTSTVCAEPSNCDFSIEDLQITSGQCSAGFFEAGPKDIASSSEGIASWRAHGRTEYLVNGDLAIDSTIDASAVRATDQHLSVSGSYALDFVTLLGRLGYADIGRAQIAVIRFAADPAELLGLLPTSAEDLVTAGLIQESDILYVTNDFDHTLSYPTDFSFDVDVTGIPDDELFLVTLAIGDVGLPEPDQSMLLAAGSLGLIVLARRRERLRRWRAPSNAQISALRRSKNASG